MHNLKKFLFHQPTLQNHPLLDALLKPAVLTPVPLRLRDLAVPVRHARVHPPVLHGPLEEPLAPLARDDPVVEPRRLILADHAYHRLLLVVALLRPAHRRLAHRSRLRLAPRVQHRRSHRRSQVQRLELLIGRQLRQVARPQPLHVQRHRCEGGGEGGRRRSGGNGRSRRLRSRSLLAQVK